MTSGDKDRLKTIEEVETEIDAAPRPEREELVERIRECMRQTENAVTAEDEEIMSRFIEGQIRAEELALHFGERV